MHKLKKYPNRRLYNTTESKYVTIDDVRDIITKGESIEVVDSKDDEDITRSVLLQILAEQESSGHGTVLTNRVIEQMIRFYGDQLGAVAARYIEQSVVTFLNHQDQMRAHLKQLNDLNPMNMMKQVFDPPAPTPKKPE
ncbi:MAG: polyhydroxyalkanoate synthesis repressor PhaR [Pseudomonadales bacterium]|nr:polyhydroxyalkanoate synthesis repressor PhaR [Pseudomonadales bacterium]